jgi:hypothetical protein
LGQIGLSDAERLAFAASKGRCLVSANAREFRRLGRDAIEHVSPHAGIVVCPLRIHGLDIGAVVNAVVRIVERSSAKTSRPQARLTGCRASMPSAPPIGNPDL